MFDSNINQLVKLLISNRESWLVFLFPLYYPLGVYFPFQLFLLHNIGFTWINLVWLYLGMWGLFLVRAGFRKLEFQLGLVITRLNDQAARILAFFFDQLLVLVAAAVVAGSLLHALGAMVSLLVYEFIFVLPGYFWHYFDTQNNV